MASRFLPDGIPAPPFELEAVYTRRRFNLSEQAGKPVLLVFIGYDSRDTLREVLEEVRTSYPSLDRVVVAGVINLLFVPGMLRKTVQNFMENAIRQGLKEVPSRFDPLEHLILLADWSGSVSRAYRITAVGKDAALVLIDAEGSIHGHYQGDQPAQAALELVADVMASSEDF